MSARRIGILTGGGDVPGLNSVIKSVVYRATEQSCEVTGIRLGWQGLTHVNLDDRASRQEYIMPLSRENTRTIDRFGGTILHSSRISPNRVKELPAFLHGQSFPSQNGNLDLSSQVLKNLERLGIDDLIAIGGDGTLSYASELGRRGVRVIGIPKTMDNDVRNTEYCIGFSTAVTRATAAIGRQRTTIGSHERIGIFRIFGRKSGFTALYTAYATSIRCVIPEFSIKVDKLIDLLLTEKGQTPSNYALVVLSESAAWEGYVEEEYGRPDHAGHRKKVSVGEALAVEIGYRTREESTVSDLTYDLRSGEPDFVDKMIATTYGNMALDAVLQGKTGLMTALVDGCYAMTELPDPKLGARYVDVPTMYNTERYRPNYTNKTGLPIFMTRA